MNDAMEARKRHVLAVSDATGATCELVAQAALSQFQSTDVVLERVPNIRTVQQIDETMARAAGRHGVIVYTMVDPLLRQHMLESGMRLGIPTVDILGPILTRLSEHLEISPLSKPGIFRHLDDEYFRRIAAVDFAVSHDDGLGLDTLHKAEIVIVGVSRTSKTPVSLYLSLRGWKVANIPLVAAAPLPQQLSQVDPRRVVGFTIDPPFLQHLREDRARHIGAGPMGTYTDQDQIKRELVFAKRLFHREGWPVLNVTAKAIEETASEVMRVVYSRTGERRGPAGPDGEAPLV